METLSSSDRSVVDVPLYQTTAYLNTHQNSSYLFGSVPHQRSKSMGQFQYSPSVDPRTRETNSLMTDRYYTNFPIFMGSSSGQQQWMSANSMGNQQRLAPQPTQQNFNRTPDYGRQPPLKTTSYLSTYTQQPPTKLLPTKQSCNSRPFKCDQCPQSFNRTHDLKRHKRIHLALKPFSCRPCEKSFSRKDALKRHVLVKGCGKARRGARSSMNVDEQTAMDMLEAIGNLTEDENPLHLGSMMN